MLAEIARFHGSLQIPTDGLQKTRHKNWFPSSCCLPASLSGWTRFCMHSCWLFKVFLQERELGPLSAVLFHHLCSFSAAKAPLLHRWPQSTQHRRGCLCDSVTEATAPGLKPQPHQSLNTVQGNILNLVHRKRELPKLAPASQQTPLSVCA